MILRIFTLLLLTVFLASCGSKKGTVPVKLKILQSGITSGSIALDGGVLIMGKSEDGLNSFRVGVPSSNSDLTLDLVKGRWEFAAVGWAGGSGILSGTNSCAYAGFVDLKDNDSSVTFNFTKARCADTFNGRIFSEHLNSSVTGQFLQFYPVPCFQSTVATFNSTNCPTSPSVGDRPSNLLSYKIIFEGEQKGQVTGLAASLVSQCFGVFGGAYPYVPMTSTSTDSPLGFSVQFFTDSACTSVPVTYNFKNGPLLNNLPFPNVFTPYGNYYSYFFFNPGAIHDVRIPNSALSVLGIPSALLMSSNYYVNSPVVGFTINTHPESAVEMCLTETTCTAGNWTPLVNSGTFTLSAGNALKTIKLFHRNINGVVSTNYASFALHAVTMPVALATPQSNVQSTYITLTWTPAPIDEILIASSRLRLCDTSSCGIPYFDQFSIPIATGSYTIAQSNLLASIPVLSTVYAKLEATDIFGNSASLPWPIITVTSGIAKP